MSLKSASADKAGKDKPFNVQRSMRAHLAIISVSAAVLVVGIGGWAATAQIASAVIAAGRVVVESNVKKVQHQTGGIVKELLVSEGANVEAGQVLMRLDGTTVRANLSMVENVLAQLYARRARLLAERSGASSFTSPRSLNAVASKETADTLIESEQKLFTSKTEALKGMKSQLASRKLQLDDEISGLSVQLDAIATSLDLIDEELQGVDVLYKKGLMSIQRVVELKRRRADLEGDRGGKIAAKAQSAGRKNEIDLQILQLDSDQQNEAAKELTEVEGRIAEYEDRRNASLNDLDRLDIKAPTSGRVLQLAVHTVNGVIGPAEVLALVVPGQEQLTVEANIATKDIDQIHTGQAVKVRLSAFNQRTTPEIEGEVASVAPDLVTDQRTGASYYPMKVRLHPDSLVQLKDLTLYPGMPAEIFASISARTVMSYLMKPLSDQLTHVFREE